MSVMNGNMFPHDGEHGRNCTGYGCDCDEKNYGRSGGGSGGGCLSSILSLLVAFGILWLLAIGGWTMFILLVILLIAIVAFLSTLGK